MFTLSSVFRKYHWQLALLSVLTAHWSKPSKQTTSSTLLSLPKSRSRCGNWSHTHKPFVKHCNTSFETYSLDGKSKYDLKLKKSLKNHGWCKHTYTCSFGRTCLLLSSHLHSTYELENQSQVKSFIILVIMRQLLGSSTRHRVCRQHSSFPRKSQRCPI